MSRDFMNGAGFILDQTPQCRSFILTAARSGRFVEPYLASNSQP